jgi:hypothetical protein
MSQGDIDVLRRGFEAFARALFTVVVGYYVANALV